MRDRGHNARVFISCGQTYGSNETDVAERISRKLKDLGFKTYIATGDQTLKGIKENIFPKLEESEYFIFIDFKREKLENGEYRGSLFSHQELAVATYLDKEVLAFQEDGIKKNDGILGSIQANSIPFLQEDRHLLPSVIADRVRELEWNADWQNEIVVERNPVEYTDAFQPRTDKRRRWYHLDIKNCHYKKIAFDCTVYLESMKCLSTGETKTFPPVEFKWQGLRASRVIIPPNYTRSLDAFNIPHSSPNTAFFGIHSDLVDFSGWYKTYSLTGPGKFELNFVVFSLNFSPVRHQLILNLGDSLEDVRFEIP